MITKMEVSHGSGDGLFNLTLTDAMCGALPMMPDVSMMGVLVYYDGCDNMPECNFTVRDDGNGGRKIVINGEIAEGDADVEVHGGTIVNLSGLKAEQEMKREKAKKMTAAERRKSLSGGRQSAVKEMLATVEEGIRNSEDQTFLGSKQRKDYVAAQKEAWERQKQENLKRLAERTEATSGQVDAGEIILDPTTMSLRRKDSWLAEVSVNGLEGADTPLPLEDGSDIQFMKDTGMMFWGLLSEDGLKREVNLAQYYWNGSSIMHCKTVGDKLRAVIKYIGDYDIYMGSLLTVLLSKGTRKDLTGILAQGGALVLFRGKDGKRQRTAFVDGTNMFISMEMLSALPLPHLAFLIMHELRHLLNRDCMRGVGHFRKYWNIAIDAVVNMELAKLYCLDRFKDPYSLIDGVHERGFVKFADVAPTTNKSGAGKMNFDETAAELDAIFGGGLGTSVTAEAEASVDVVFKPSGEDMIADCTQGPMFVYGGVFFPDLDISVMKAEGFYKYLMSKVQDNGLIGAGAPQPMSNANGKTPTKLTDEDLNDGSGSDDLLLSDPSAQPGDPNSNMSQAVTMDSGEEAAEKLKKLILCLKEGTDVFGNPLPSTAQASVRAIVNKYVGAFSLPQI